MKKLPHVKISRPVELAKDAAISARISPCGSLASHDGEMACEKNQIKAGLHSVLRRWPNYLRAVKNVKFFTARQFQVFGLSDHELKNCEPCAGRFEPRNLIAFIISNEFVNYAGTRPKALKINRKTVIALYVV
jgi:hypothetical protein